MSVHWKELNHHNSRAKPYFAFENVTFSLKRTSGRPRRVDENFAFLSFPRNVYVIPLFPSKIEQALFPPKFQTKKITTTYRRGIG